MKYFANYNQETGEIISISVNQKDHAIEIKKALFERFHEGEEQLIEWHVVFDKQFSPSFVKKTKTNNKFNISNNIYVLDVVKPENNCFVITETPTKWILHHTLDDNAKQYCLSDSKFSLAKPFYVVSETNHLLLYDTLWFDYNKVLQNDLAIDKKSAGKFRLICRSPKERYIHYKEL